MDIAIDSIIEEKLNESSSDNEQIDTIDYKYGIDKIINFICGPCVKIFKSDKTFNNHLNGDDHRTTIEQIKEKLDYKKMKEQSRTIYTCYSCNKTYNTHSSFSHHINKSDKHKKLLQSKFDGLKDADGFDIDFIPCAICKNYIYKEECNDQYCLGTDIGISHMRCIKINKWIDIKKIQ